MKDFGPRVRANTADQASAQEAGTRIELNEAAESLHKELFSEPWYYAVDTCRVDKPALVLYVETLPEFPHRYATWKGFPIIIRRIRHGV